MGRAPGIVCRRILILCLFCATVHAAETWDKLYQDGLKALEAGRWEEAIQKFEQAIAKEPTPSKWKIIEGVHGIEYFPYYHLGLAYYQTGRLEEARRALMTARTHGKLPKDKLRNVEKLLTELERPPRLLPDQFEPLIQEGQQALNAKRYQEAEKKLRQAKTLERKEFQKRGLEALLEKAAGAVQRGLELVKEGQSLLKAGNLAKARETFQKAEEILPGDNSAKEGLAEVERGEQESARSESQAGQLAGEGERFLNQGDLERARERFEKALQTYRGQKLAQDGLAELRRREQDYVRSKNEAQGDHSAGRLAAARSKYLQAQQVYPQAFKADGLEDRIRAIDIQLEVEGLWGQAQGAYQQGNYEQALIFLNRILARQPTHAEAKAYRDRTESRLFLREGKQLAGEGKYAEAEKRYQAAVDKDSYNQHAEIALDQSQRYVDFRTRGKRLFDSDRKAEGQDLLKQARALDPIRFDREGLGPLVRPLEPPVSKGQSVSGEPVQAEIDLKPALTALFSGRIEDSIRTLEELKNKGAPTDPHLYAYLAVAYATAALCSVDREKASRMQAIAQEEFRVAKSIQPSYQLSQRLVSPRVREMLAPK